MRTAIITGLTHEGKGVLISGKEVGLLKQLEVFNTFKKGAILDGSHSEYQEVSYQENDGGEMLLTFRTPAAQKEHLKKRAQEKEAHAKQVDSAAARENSPRIPIKANEVAPTISEYVKAGKDPRTYPPAGLPPQSTKQEIANAIVEFEKSKTVANPKNEFKREDLQAKSQGELLALVKTLVEAKRIEPPAKTSPTALIEAILAAKPLPAGSETL